MTQITSRHLPIITLALRAMVGSRPALPALRSAVLCTLPAGAEGVASHPDRYAFCGVLTRQVLTSGCEQLQVFRRIVEPVVVFVVNRLLSGEQPAKHPLHDQPVLKCPAAGGLVRVVRLVLLNVGHILELLDSGGANLYWLAGGNQNAQRSPAYLEAVCAHRLSGSVWPANDWGLTFCTGKYGSWLRRHTCMITRGRIERNSYRQSEWVTLNRPPVQVPGQQQGLFGGGR